MDCDVLMLSAVLREMCQYVHGRLQTFQAAERRYNPERRRPWRQSLSQCPSPTWRPTWDTRLDDLAPDAGASPIPIPNRQLDLRLQRVPDLPIGLRPCPGLREALLGLPPMLRIGGRNPRPALLGPWTSGPPPV